MVFFGPLWVTTATVCSWWRATGPLYRPPPCSSDILLLLSDHQPVPTVDVRHMQTTPHTTTVCSMYITGLPKYAGLLILIFSHIMLFRWVRTFGLLILLLETSFQTQTLCKYHKQFKSLFTLHILAVHPIILLSPLWSGSLAPITCLLYPVLHMTVPTVLTLSYPSIPGQACCFLYTSLGR